MDKWSTARLLATTGTIGALLGVALTYVTYLYLT